MAKKRKATRGTPRGAKKKKTARKAARRPTRAVAAAPQAFVPMFEGLASTKEVHFGPLKTHIKAHIERLRGIQQPSPKVQNALKSLEQVQADLTGECLPTMIIPTP